MGLDLLRMCDISTEDMSATGTADAVGLIDQGADVQAKNIGGGTPLHRACWNGHAEVVKALLETSTARWVLPEKVSRKEAVYNIGRVAWLIIL
jgi:ankyrin repeat protein